jgi:hypothetical protein
MRRWIGWIVSGLAVLFLLFDSVIKLLGHPAVAESLGQLGFPLSFALAIGLLELVCLIIYVIPQTSVLGAILLTGYLGGAVASQMRIEAPLVSNILFPVYIGLLLWGGLFLREDRLHALIPLRSPQAR